MNYLVILSGGIGSRLGDNLPKQYLKVNDRTVLSFCLETFQKHEKIDKIVIVAVKEYHELILGDIKNLKADKFLCFADAGISRQHSILNGLNAIKSSAEISDEDVVLIHDAVRPNVTSAIIDDALNLNGYDGTLPVIRLADSVYYSENGECVDKLLDRSKLFAGQSPEGFLFTKYLKCHENLTDEEIASSTGSSQIAFRKGMKIRFSLGEMSNYKITTIEDLEKFRVEKSKNILD